MNKVYAIVVTHNGEKWINRCIGSLIQSSVPLDILVIDNCSKDGTLKCIREKYQSIKIIEQKKNIGFGRANNIGFNFALENRADFVFLLNQDAWISIDTIEKLIKAFQYDDQFGIISPLHFNGSGIELDFLFHVYLSKQFMRNRKTISNLLLQKDLNRPYEISFVNAAAWMLKKKTIIRVGGFDPIFTHWGEDNNYINRLKSKRMKVGVCFKAKAFHDREGNLNNRESFFKDYYFRSLLNKILDPNNSFGIRKAKKIVLVDSIRGIATLNFSKVVKSAKAFQKICDLSAEIEKRAIVYKKEKCFL